MATLNGIPVFKIKINESLNDKTGWDVLSLVDYPAIESNWIAMSDKKSPLQFSFSTDKKLLYGPALIPDLPIYRYDKKMGEYYVVFTKEEIETIVRKRQKQQKNLSFNYQHQSESKIDAVMQEIWLTGKSDKSKDFGFDLPEGSAFVVTYVEDDKFWNEQVKTGNVKGYSIEGWLDMEAINQELNKYKMSKEKFAEAKASNGVVIKSDSETFAPGVDVYTVNEAGEKQALTDPEYTLENGTVIKVAEGKITEIVEVDEEMTEEEIAVMSKLFNKVLKPLNDKIAELEVKLSNIPAVVSKTEKTDEKPEKEPTAKESAFARIEKVKSIINKNKNK